ncbi:MAG: HAMP domain-containing histidine kinase [Saprospiraceae bacterium]|nr:HAMP domain-containing histidine kinase [Saprospiraceae bacterium]
MGNRNMRLLSNVVIAYMLLAFAWWSVLLFTKNKDAFRAKSEYAQLVMVAEGSISTKEEFLDSKEYEDLYQKYRRQEWMILGEAAVFIISLVIGIYLINRGYRKEMNLAHQRRNFLLSITHELKSPIASLKLILETFKKRRLNEQKFLELSDNGIHEAERLNDLVNNLLLAAKLETAYEPVPEDLDLNEVCEETLERMRNKHPFALFSFSTEIGPHFINADRFGLESILTNLLENAVKYSPDSPKIECHLRTDPVNLILSVSDHGLGIPVEERTKVLERFYRVGDERTRTTKGTGLGLYIVNQIIKAHKGSIRILDNEPTGTKIEILLPISLLRKRESKREQA